MTFAEERYRDLIVIKERCGRTLDSREEPHGRLPDIVDESQARSAEALDDLLRDKATIEHRAAMDAIQRIKLGIYGRCLMCREQIPEARLKAVPWAARCKGCEGKHERV